MAYRLDARLSGLAAAANVHYTRYADDLLFSGDRLFGRQATKFTATVGAIVLEQGFQVNHHKTKIQFASQRQTATGIVLNQHPNINRRDYDRLKAVLFNCVKDFGRIAKTPELWRAQLQPSGCFAQHARYSTLMP